MSRWEDAAPADLAAEETYVLPGLIHADVTLDNLRRTFGTGNVTVAEIDGAEGGKVKGVVRFADDPPRRAERFVRDEETQGGVSLARVRAVWSRWHVPRGIRPDIPLGDFVPLNGAAVSFMGLDGGYGGAITGWHGGKAPQRAGDVVGMAGPGHADTPGHADDTDSCPVGEEVIHRDDKRYPAMGVVLRVSGISVAFGDQGLAEWPVVRQPSARSSLCGVGASAGRDVAGSLKSSGALSGVA